MKNIDRIASGGRTFPTLNWVLLACTLGLLVYGVLFVRSAVSVRVGAVHDLWTVMLFRWIPLGLAAHFVFAAFDYRRWVDYAWLLYLGALLLLVLVLVPGIGTTNNMGARRWLMGFFQPSEFAKVAVVPTLAFILAGSTLERETSRFWVALAAAAVPAGLIMLEPDLGTVIPIVAAAFAMVFVAGCARKTLFVLVLSGLVAVTVFLSAILVPESLPPEQKARVEKVTNLFIYEHWKDRILTFVHPDRDPLGAGWNKRQSEIAVGSGGRSGKGYMKGTQNALGYLPASVSSSDFIFSVIAEETGFTGTLGLLGLFAGLLTSIVVAGLRTYSQVGRLLCTGVSAILFTHIFINVAMTIGLLPITGIPLPLVSYGGTFTISTLALLGIAHGVSIHRSLPESEY